MDKAMVLPQTLLQGSWQRWTALELSETCKSAAVWGKQPYIPSKPGTYSFPSSSSCQQVLIWSTLFLGHLSFNKVGGWGFQRGCSLACSMLHKSIEVQASCPPSWHQFPFTTSWKRITVSISNGRAGSGSSYPVLSQWFSGRPWRSPSPAFEGFD